MTAIQKQTYKPTKTATHKANQKPQTVRIIGGQWRRSILHFPVVEGLRPTPDRVRETLFNWLGQQLIGKHCLDLFAGSGALGFEAASRGASRVVLVEASPLVAASLKQTISRLSGASTVMTVMPALAESVLKAGSITQVPERFDVIFVDPPFASDWLTRYLPLVADCLAPHGVVYVECAVLPSLSDWEIVKQGKAGQVHFLLLRAKSALD